MALSILILLSVISMAYGASCPASAPGAKSNVYCVSKTQFVLGFMDPSTAQPLRCPEGQVCADLPEICSATAVPSCLNTIPGTEGLCNECDPSVTTTALVCVNDTAFGFCVGGVIQRDLVFPCKTPTPYCKIDPGVSTCTAELKLLDCPVSDVDVPTTTTSASTTSSLPSTSSSESTSTSSSTPISTTPTSTTTPDTTSLPPINFSCAMPGYFPNTTDRTCFSYFKCQQLLQGGFNEFSLSCQRTNYAFDPALRRCVLKTSFVCPYALPPIS